MGVDQRIWSERYSASAVVRGTSLWWWRPFWSFESIVIVLIWVFNFIVKIENPCLCNFDKIEYKLTIWCRFVSWFHELSYDYSLCYALVRFHSSNLNEKHWEIKHSSFLFLMYLSIHFTSLFKNKWDSVVPVRDRFKYWGRNIGVINNVLLVLYLNKWERKYKCSSD